jgi:type I restriction enzyme S subunit
MKFNESKFNKHWQDKNLSELGKFQRGKSKHRPRNDQVLFENGIYPLVQTGDIKEANLYIRQHKEAYNEIGLSQSKLWKKNTLCITIAANIAETALLAYPMCFPDSVVGFNAYPHESSELFMHYVFTYIKKSIQNSATGSIQDNINIDYLTQLKFKIPNKVYQDKIVFILSSLDDKIELNNRINSELENLAKTIYDYWFVQFDFPDENGKPYKSSGGKMVYNQEIKREIPAGWEVKLLGDIGKNIKNGIKQTDIDPEIPYIGLEHIPRKKIALDTWSTAFDLASDKLSFARRDILFGKLRPYFHKVGVAFISGVCSTDILVLNSKKESYFGFFLMVVSSDNFINYVNLATEGTRMPRTKWEFMKQYLLPIPKEDITQKFNDILKPLISQMENNTYQNQQLTQLRDWLLPMLMNGQITIK